MFAIAQGFSHWLTYNWDITLIVAIATVVMGLQSLYLSRQRIEARLICAAWVVYLVFCLISIVSVDYMGRSERQTGLTQLLEIATTCAVAVEKDGHEMLSFETPRDDPIWEHLMDLLGRWGEENKRFASIYTVRMETKRDENGKPLKKPLFFLCPEVDFNRNGVIDHPFEEEVPSGTPYTAPSERFLDETLSGRPYFAEELVVDKWGTWYTAGVPLRDRQGKVNGILCIDFIPEVWRADVLRARAWSLAFFASFLITFFIVINFIARLSVTVRSLTLANHKAEEAAQSKSRFLANMSHEIRTPINAILGFIQILAARHAVKSREELEMFELISKNSKDLLTIIDDILTFSKVDSGHMIVERVPVSPRQILEDVQKTMAPRFAEKPGVRFCTEVLGEIPEYILSDPTRLRQIITNVVGNALKFTSKGQVKVCCEQLSRKANPDSVLKGEETVVLRFSMTDTGIGIDREKLGKLFRPFTQADTSSTRKYGGTGLGLSISKRLAELLGGDLTVQSEPNRGSRFDLTLNAVVPTQEQLESEENATVVFTKPPGKALQQTSERKSSPMLESLSFAGRRFLIVDDGKINQIVLLTSLKDHGAEVETADNGREAIEIIERFTSSERPFDVVFMDIQMPVMDGIEATKELRNKGYHHPIVAVTANAFAEDRASALDAGCDDYLAKPVNIQEMLQLIRKLLEEEM